MISVATGLRVYLTCGTMDMRKGMAGLAMLVQQTLSEDPFGGAVACGKLMGFDAEHMRNALGIAGSLSGGLMEFARSGTGAMVKRLHLGRAAESGVVAASLVADGFTGPVSVLEGEFGFLKVFCTEWDESHLTKGLGGVFGKKKP